MYIFLPVSYCAWSVAAKMAAKMNTFLPASYCAWLETAKVAVKVYCAWYGELADGGEGQSVHLSTCSVLRLVGGNQCGGQQNAEDDLHGS